MILAEEFKRLVHLLEGRPDVQRKLAEKKCIIDSIHKLWENYE
jgi:hypothetical protein